MSTDDRSRSFAVLFILVVLPILAVLLGFGLATCLGPQVFETAEVEALHVVEGTRRRPAADEPIPPQFPTVIAVGRSETGIYIVTGAPEQAIIEASTLFEDASIAVTGMYPATINGPYWEHFADWVEWVINKPIDDPCFPTPEPRFTENLEGFGRIMTGTALADEAEKWRAEVSPLPWGEWDPAGPGMCYRIYEPVITR
jgi:hypothetical protein